jgi:signal transduction histidine kinase
MAAVDRIRQGIRQASPAVVDALIGAGIFLLGLSLLFLPGDNTFVAASQRLLAVPILAVEAVAVSLRRTHIVVACLLAALTAATGFFTGNEYWGTYLSQLILLYTISERCSLATSLIALAVQLILALASTWFTGPITAADIGPLFGMVFDIMLPYSALVVFAGRMQARRHALATDLERTAGELGLERDRFARDAIAAERVRIGRELRDIVVRSVAWMRQEARTARAELDRNLLEAIRLIAAIESRGRSALVEMRRLLQVLRAQQERGAPSQEGLPAEDGVPRSPVDRPTEGAASDGSGNPVALRLRLRRAAGVPWVTDLLIVFVMVVFFVVERVADPYWLEQGPGAVPLALLVVAALLFRRFIPLGVLVLIVAVMFIQTAFLGGESNTSDRAILVAVFTVAALKGPWWGLVAVGGEAIAFLPYPLGAEGPDACGVACYIGWTVLFGFVLIAGLGVRSARRLNAELERTNRELRQTRKERVRLAVERERSRIARDVHDMVAHGVTLMVIQAGAARWLAETDALKAAEALRGVESAGSQALAELDSLVGPDAASDPSVVLAPQAGAEIDIGSLVADAAAAGMDVSFAVRGEPHDLADGMEVSLYRIVQETLTNARKHAPGASVRIELRYTPEGVEVEVMDCGGRIGTEPPPIPGAGQGLVGIAERAALFGGRAEYGQTADGGYRVWATLSEERVLA